MLSQFGYAAMVVISHNAPRPGIGPVAELIA